MRLNRRVTIGNDVGLQQWLLQLLIRTIKNFGRALESCKVGRCKPAVEQ